MIDISPFVTISRELMDGMFEALSTWVDQSNVLFPLSRLRVESRQVLPSTLSLNELEVVGARP